MPMQDLEFDITVIGAGVVGLASAKELSAHSRRVLLLEKNASFGEETSSRSSEVVHAGIYHPAHFLKASLCRDGNRLLYETCGENGIPFRKTGKMILSQDASETQELEKIRAQGEDNGVAGLAFLPRSRWSALEPEIRAQEVLFSPETGIVDSHRLMRFFRVGAQERGVTMSFRAEVTAIRNLGGGYDLDVNGGEYRLRTRVVVNSAGLHACRVAGLAGMDVERKYGRLRYAKGDYFSASPAPGLNHLIYPAPAPAFEGLGIHATLDLGGRVRFGPDVEYVDRIDYRVQEDKRQAFFSSVVRYLPKIETRHLWPDMSGIRPKLQGPGEAPRDFVIEEESSSGYPGFINLIGIESPGLTCAMPIARRVCALAEACL